MTAGRFFFTPHAVRRYIERVEPGITFSVALGRLIKLGDKVHLVKKINGGKFEVWRGPKPDRLRLIVAPVPEMLPAVLTVLRGND